MQYDIVRITIELISAIACAVLVRFMIKPYHLTREGRYLGLPLGFGILGLSYFFTVILLSPLLFHNAALSWLAHLTRVFAFVFLAVTYLFSKTPSKNSRLLWDLTLTLLIVILITISLVLIFTPTAALARYGIALVFLRVLSLICLSYVIIHMLREHMANPHPTTIWVPFGFILLAISQFSLLLINFCPSYASLCSWGGLAFRLAGLAVVLLVSYRTFYCTKKAYK